MSGWLLLAYVCVAVLKVAVLFIACVWGGSVCEYLVCW